MIRRYGKKQCTEHCIHADCWRPLTAFHEKLAKAHWPPGYTREQRKGSVPSSLYLDGTKVPCIGGLMNYPSDPRDANVIYKTRFTDIHLRV